MTNILIINVGSSSVKFRLYADEAILLDGMIDQIGQHAMLVIKSSSISGIVSRAVHATSHHEAGNVIKQLLAGVPISRTVHRIVHGGNFSTPVLVNDSVLEYMRTLIPLAPLHMPAALELIDLFPKPAVLCFDTMFHSTMPSVAKTYAIPQDLAEKNMIRRFGFHGLAHESLAHQATAMLGHQHLRIISCQLGNGASVCAIQNGKSIDTSMGFTPLEGLVMGTRSGDIDAAIIPFLCEREHMKPAAVLELLEKKSGLLALGGSADVRELLALKKKGDTAATFALALYAYRVRKYLGAYIAVMGGVDAITIGGGTSKSPIMRKLILEGLEELGIELDEATIDQQAPVVISKGRVKVLVLEADEEEQMRVLSEKYLGDAS